MTPAEARAWGRGVTTRIATRDFPAEVLALVDARQGGRFCEACRRHGLPPSAEQLEVDHLQPLSRGGDNGWQNLRWLCRGHNRSRGNRADPHPIPPSARGPVDSPAS